MPEPIYTPVTGSDVSINFMLKIFPKVHADVEECLENFNWITACLACYLTGQHSVNKNLATFQFLLIITLTALALNCETTDMLSYTYESNFTHQF